MAKRKLGDKLGRKAEPLVDKVAGSPEDFAGPSPNPHTNLVIADVALRSGSMLARRAVERALLGSRYTPRKARAILKGRTLGETLLHTAVAKVATRSVPGMILVGGGLLAKTLYDRSRGSAAKVEGEIALHEQAEDGEEDENKAG
ncbi:hypothetical protein B2G71_14070 [Novosphingobium sp. PC22D]|uniref:hypothetical protein n=1 Tax=Novosphingobium sp. PC22D TaxID=1962403 RepID=UPI000BF16FEF|nr:hypothetical protein [Novosphingobium sp. PC22D]PEQ11909.1 hypothetical protein B2G71_14070 [Novosphingobium sp. PC22D]